MAEGGIAAALANVDDRDSWKVHFADTMRGGQYVNNWRMAELHAKEAPDRVRELEAWGAVFDRTQGRPHPPAQLRRPPLSAARARRRSHRSRDDPHAAGSRDPPGHRRPHGVHRRHACSRTAAASSARSATSASAGASSCSARRRSSWRPAASAAPTRSPSNSWEYTGDGHTLAYDAGAELMDMEFVQFHPTGMIWPPSVRGILVTEGVRGEGGVLQNSEGRRFMFDDIPENYRSADGGQRGRRAGATRRATRSARRPPELLTRDHVSALHRARGQGRAAAARTAACSSTSRGSRSGSRTRAEHIKKKLPSMYHQFKQLADIDITPEPMEVGPTTHYIMGGVRVDGDTQMSTVPGLFAAGECAAGINGANRLGGNSLVGPARVRASAPANSPRSCARSREQPPSTPRGRRSRAARPLGAVRSAAATARVHMRIQHELQEHDAGPGRASCAPSRRCSRRSRGSTRLRALARRVGVAAPRVQPRLAHCARSPQPAHGVGGDHALGDRAAARAAAVISATTIPDKEVALSATCNLIVRKGRDGADGSRRGCRSEMPAELRECGWKEMK